jgi:maleate isomerase
MNIAVPIVSRPVKVTLDQGRHWRAKLGFVVLAMEQTVEADVIRMTPPGVGIHFSRMPMSNEATLETLASMAPDITDAAALLLPDAEPNVLCYTCNSGAMVIGETTVMHSLLKAKETARPTTVMTGVVRALEALHAKKIVVATPYLDEINTVVHRFLTGWGFEVLELQGMNLKVNTEIDLVDPAFIKDYARSVDRPDADAVFICCGALRAVDIAQELEDELGKPVIVSNQAMMWDCLRLAGIPDAIEGYGRIFQHGLEAHEQAVARLRRRAREERAR